MIVPDARGYVGRGIYARKRPSIVRHIEGNKYLSIIYYAAIKYRQINK